MHLRCDDELRVEIVGRFLFCQDTTDDAPLEELSLLEKRDAALADRTLKVKHHVKLLLLRDEEQQLCETALFLKSTKLAADFSSLETAIQLHDDVISRTLVS